MLFRHEIKKQRARTETGLKKGTTPLARIARILRPPFGNFVQKNFHHLITGLQCRQERDYVKICLDSLRPNFDFGSNREVL